MLGEPREELAPTRAPGGIQQQGCCVPWVLVPVLVPSCRDLPLQHPALQVGLFLLDFSRQQETSPSAHITPGVFLGWRKMSFQASVCPISDTSGGAELTQSLAVELHGLCREPWALCHVGGLVATSPRSSCTARGPWRDTAWVGRGSAPSL